MNKTDAEIEKALECCVNDIAHCFKCPYNDNAECSSELIRNCFDYFNRLKAENKRLKAVADAELDTIHDIGEDYERVLEEEPILIQKAKAEAIKEFAERLKQSAFDCDVSFGYGKEHYTKAVAVIEIDNLVKEMTENEGKE